MLFDEQSILSDNQPITANAVSTNTLYVGKNDASREDVPFKGVVTEAFNNLTKLQVLLETCANGTFATDSTTTIYDRIFELAELKQGADIAPRYVPKGFKDYVRAKYVITGTAPTTGKVKMGVVDCHDDDWADV
jgi:hypothetical protein